MNGTKTKKFIFTLFFEVLLLLCLAGALVALSAPGGTAYAETGQTSAEPFAPTKFTTAFSNNGYTITGFDTNDNAWTSATADQKKNIAIVIPAVYNDGSNDEHPVVAIGNNAFDMLRTEITGKIYDGCVFTSLNLSNASNLAKIGNSAFYNCKGFTGALTIPNSVTTIETLAFSGCSGFTGALTIPNSVTTIGNYAFSGGGGLTGALTIPNSVTTIGEYAFSGCKGFNDKLTLPTNDGFKTIGNYAFRNCSGLTGALTIPDSVTTIGERAFSGCKGFNDKLTLPTNDGFKTIGNYAFAYCSGLTEALTIPNSVTTIGTSAFEGCSGLTGALTIPNSITTIGNSAFRSCSGFKDKLTLPTNDGFKTIEDYAFNGCSGLTGALTIPNSVTTIGNSAFDGCSGLTGALTIPNSVTTIGKSAFRSCSGFKDKLTFPTNDGFKTIEDYTFQDCSGLTGALTIPNSVTTIGIYAFYNCKGFKDKLTLPTNDGFKMIGNYAFLVCSGLTGALTIPNSVTTIGTAAFNGCSGFETVYLPNAAGGTTYGTDVFNSNSAYPIIAPSKELYNTYKASGHNLSGYSSLTYELTVTFNANGGSVTGSNTETKLFHYSLKMEKNADGVWAENSAYALPLASKSNYAFTGWNSQSDGKGAYWAEQLLTSSINTDTPLTYYAQFSENLSGITVTGTPVKTQYTAFDTFDTTGLTVTANYESGASATITGYTVRYADSSTSLRYGDSSVTISYTENGVEKTATVSGITVNKKQLTAPTVSGTYTYSGEVQTVTLANVSDEYMTVTNNTRTDAGEHNVTVALKDTTNCEWSDGSTATLLLKWTIATAKIAKPAENTATFTYNGSEQTYQLTENSAYSITGNVKTDAGEYMVTVALNNPQGVINYEWTTGGSDALTFNFVIGKKAVAKPAITGTYEYSGSEQTANVVATTEYTVTGNRQTDAGAYTVTVTPKANYKWSDGTETALELEWKIARKKLTITPSYDTSAKVFVGGSLPAITATETTAGAIAWNTPIDLSEPATNKAFGWTWTPTDTKNYEVVTGSVNFDVLAVQLESITATFNQGQNTVYATDGIDSLKQYLTVTGMNNDGTSAGTITNYTLDGDLMSGGTVTITVSVGEVKTTFTVNVTATVLESIAVTTNPAKTQYIAFEDFDAAGMVVTATFSHGAQTVVDYTVIGGAGLQAGTTTLTVSYTYGGETKTTTVSIAVAKASIDMSGVTFADVTVKEDGQTHTIEVTGAPAGVTVAYTGTNGYTADGVSAAGVYVVTATFSVTDADNYDVPRAMTATLSVNVPQVAGGTDENGDTTVVIGGENGVKPGTSVKVEERPSEDYEQSNIVLGDEKHAVVQATDIRLERDGSWVQPDGTVTVRLLIKETLRRYDGLKVLYIAPDGITQDMNARRDGDYMVFDTTHFSVYAIVVPERLLAGQTADKPGLGGGAIFGIVFSVIIVLVILSLLALFLFRKDKSVGFKAYYVGLGKTSAAAVKGWGGKLKSLVRKDKAPEMPADRIGGKPLIEVPYFETVSDVSDDDPADIPEEESPVVVIKEEAAGTVDSIEVSEEEIEEEPEEEEIAIDDEPEELDAEIVSEGKTVRVTYRRTFLAKLIQSSPENKRYYSAVKNEFKSFGVTSSVAAGGNTFSYKRKPLGKVVIAGDTLKLYLAVDPAKLESKYNAHDASSVKKYEKTPCFIRVRSEMGLKKALVLIDRMMQAEGIDKRPDYAWTDIASIYPDEPLETLIAKDLVKVIERRPVEQE